MMNNVEINNVLNNLSKLDRVRNLDDRIAEAFEAVDSYRNYFCDVEVRNIADGKLCDIEKNFAKRKEITSDSYFDDDRSTFLEYEEACLRLVQIYRKELTLLCSSLEINKDPVGNSYWVLIPKIYFIFSTIPENVHLEHIIKLIWRCIHI